MSITQEPARRAGRSVALHRAGSDDDVWVRSSPDVESDVANVSPAEMPRDVTILVTLHDAGSSDRADAEIELPQRASDLVLAFVSRLQKRIREQGVDGLDGLDAGAIADRLLAAVPSIVRSPWDELVGPFYDTKALTQWLGKTKQRLSVLRKEDRLLGLTTVDGETVHPAFQFAVDGSLLPRLSEVTRVLRRAIDDEWTRALWLNTPVEEWNESTAADLLHHSDEGAEEVIRMAEQDVASRRV